MAARHSLARRVSFRIPGAQPNSPCGGVIPDCNAVRNSRELPYQSADGGADGTRARSRLQPAGRSPSERPQRGLDAGSSFSCGGHRWLGGYQFIWYPGRSPSERPARPRRWEGSYRSPAGTAVPMRRCQYGHNGYFPTESDHYVAILSAVSSPGVQGHTYTITPGSGSGLGRVR